MGGLSRFPFLTQLSFILSVCVSVRVAHVLFPGHIIGSRRVFDRFSILNSFFVVSFYLCLYLLVCAFGFEEERCRLNRR